MLKRIFGALAVPVIVFGFSVTASAEASETENFHRSGDWGYTVLGDGTAALSGYYGTDTEISVPEKLDGYTVTSLGGGWYTDGGETVLYGNVHGIVYSEDGEVSESSVYSPFSGNADIVTVELPDSVEYVGAISFKNCTALQSVTFGANTEVIGNNCFEGCTSLESLEIPESAVLIDQQACTGCTSLKTVSFSGGSCGSAAFENCTSLESIEIPESWGTVPNRVFSGCTSLASVTVPDGISEIGAGAFENCTSLESIVLPDSVKIIYSDAFNGCTALESAELGESLDTLGSRAFADCGLKTLSVPETLVRIGDSAFGMSADGEVDPDFVLDCGKYSAAEAYAAEKGIACTSDLTETEFESSEAIGERVVGNSKMFALTLIALAAVAAAIVMQIVLTVKNRKIPDDDDEIGEEKDSAEGEEITAEPNENEE